MKMQSILVPHPTILHLTTATRKKERYKYCHHGVDRVNKYWPYNTQSLTQTPATSCEIRGEGVSLDSP
jgi:hypothetical protein